MTTNEVQPARMTDDLRHVIDCDGNRLKLDDTRVVHVWSCKYYRHAATLVVRVFKRRGWRVRIGQDMATSVLHKAKVVCSGKECPGLNAIVGAAIIDMEQCRTDDEVTLYYGLDNLGPCAAIAWGITSAAFLRKLGVRNVVFPGSTALQNNYMGQGTLFGWEVFSAFAVADILEEAESALRCTAKDLPSALAAFDEAVGILCDAFDKGLMAYEGGLKKWAEAVAKIPRHRSVESLPKVLMLGGGNAIVYHQPMIEYFAGQGVLLKPNEMTDFILHTDADLPRIVAFASAHGVEKQFAVGTRALSAITGGGMRLERNRALVHAISVKAGASSIEKFRRIAQKSGLLFGGDVAFAASSLAGDELMPDQVMLEAVIEAGRLRLSIEQGVFDAALHVNSFNCYQGNIAQALLKETAGRHNFPFAILELDSIEVKTQHHTLLETICSKAKSRHGSTRRAETP